MYSMKVIIVWILMTILLHNIFGRITKFRECYDGLKSLKEDFPTTPIMASMAMLSDNELGSLLRNPFGGSVA